MKIYRSIEFSKLLFLLKEDYQFFWDELQSKRDQENDARLHRNWWMNDASIKDRREVISSIIQQNHQGFFENSFEFNAMAGGRFNPEGSFGLLYCSNTPVVSALEVLFHNFADLSPIHGNIQRNEFKLSSAFDMTLPNELSVLIIAFEIEIDDISALEKINDSQQGLGDACGVIGFSRYTNAGFDRDFIFGNDYEISRHLGSYLYSKQTPGFLCPSARIEFEIQDELGVRNCILVDKHKERFNPRLTGNFLEFRATVDMRRDDHKGHDVIIHAYGKSEVSSTFKLQKTPPNKRTAHPQIKTYYPITNASTRKPRSVQVQRFFSIPEKEEK